MIRVDLGGGAVARVRADAGPATLQAARDLAAHVRRAWERTDEAMEEAGRLRGIAALTGDPIDRALLYDRADMHAAAARVLRARLTGSSR